MSAHSGPTPSLGVGERAPLGHARAVAEAGRIAHDLVVARAWNIFSISREARNEDQLTEMLAWLANAVPAVRRALLELAFGESLDELEVEITTQHGIAKGRLDAFLSSESVALVVESKLGSGYGDGQLRKYLTWLDTELADRQFRGLLTLTARQTRGPSWTPRSLPREGSMHKHACGRNCTRRLLPRSATRIYRHSSSVSFLKC